MTKGPKDSVHEELMDRLSDAWAIIILRDLFRSDDQQALLTTRYAIHSACAEMANMDNHRDRIRLSIEGSNILYPLLPNLVMNSGRDILSIKPG